MIGSLYFESYATMPMLELGLSLPGYPDTTTNSSNPFKYPLSPESIDNLCYFNRNLKSGVSSETTTPTELYIFLNQPEV